MMNKKNPSHGNIPDAFFTWENSTTNNDILTASKRTGIGFAGIGAKVYWVRAL